MTEIVALHAAATGGAERIAALGSLRATGEVETAGRRARFSLLAARPDRVLLETTTDGRTRVQGSDGSAPPWEFDPGAVPPRSEPMAAAAARAFLADTEFDDPLLAGPARGFALEDAGFAEVEGARLLRLLVTRRLTETFFVLLDPATYLLVRRIEPRSTAVGRRVEIVTRYGDFRPVDGVLLPHLIEVTVDGRATQRTRVDRIEPNPVFDPGVFRRPVPAEKL